MAKKKVNHKPKHDEKENHSAKHPDEAPPQLPLHRQASDAMDDSSADKLQRLKSLNARLLKETVEGRRQIESLLREKDSLEAELVGSEVGEGVVRVFVDAQAGEAVRSLRKEKSELVESLKGARSERESLRSELGALVRYVEGMREKGRVSEERERALGEKCERLARERGERERLVEGLEKERASAERLVEALREQNGEVSRAKVGLERELGMQSEEVKVLRIRVSELEKDKAEKEARIGNLESELYETEVALKSGAKEVYEKGLRIEALIREKNKVFEAKVGRENEIARLRDELLAVRDSCGVKEERIEGLVSEVGKLRDLLERVEVEKNEAWEAFDGERKSVESLKLVASEKDKVVEKLRDELFTLQNLCRDREERIEGLVSDAGKSRDALEHITVEKNEARRAFDEERKIVESLESVITEKDKRVEEFKAELAALQSLCGEKEERIEELVSQVEKCRDALERVTVEKSEAWKALDQEKETVESLKSVVSEEDKKAKEIKEALLALKDVQASLLEKSKATETRLESVTKERDSAEKSLSEAKMTIEELRARAESAGIDSKRALEALKKIASMVACSRPENKNDKVNDEDVYSVEFEAIHSAFKCKEKAVEEMKKQVEALKRSAAEANKRKSFWTLVSSATTLFAAVSMAYAAKAR